MAHVQHVRSYREIDGATRPETTVVDRDVEETPAQRGTTMAARIVWYVADVLLALLAIRFVFALLGANPGNAFAHFIYTVSYPFVAPFFSLFSYNYHYGISRFEIYTLVAMAVYALVGWAIARLLTINRHAAPAEY